MAGPRMDNGDAFMRARRAAHYAQQLYQYQQQQQHERPEPEDTTGLKMLEKFLTERRSARDGNERK